MFIRAFVAAFLFCVACLPAEAGKRIALLIGNAAYNDNIGQLQNPHNDIRLVANALTQIGFEVLAPVRDATRRDILVAVHDFAESLRKAGEGAVGFLYYSGHGVAASGKNFLIPIDVMSASSRHLRVNGVRQGEIVEILRATAPQAAHYIVLDACRNNIGGSRGAKGFVPARKEAGILFAFAAAPGQTASDDGNGGGPYAKALAGELIKPGVPDLIMFHRVRTAVIASTNGDQVPWTEDGIQRPEREYFGGKSAAAGAAVATALATPPTPQNSDAAQAWAMASQSNDCDMLDAFTRRYGGSIWSDFAETRAKKLKCPGQANTTPDAAPDTPIIDPPGAVPRDDRETANLSANCRRDLESWRQKTSMGAFAAAGNGGCGWSWGNDTLASARKAALQECRKYGDACRIVETHTVNAGDWTLSNNCQRDLKEWRPKASMGAFAVARNGACGWSWGNDTLASARQAALKECRKYRSECRIEETHTANEGD